MSENTNYDVERRENHEDKETVTLPDNEEEFDRESRDDVELLPDQLLR